MWCMYLSLACQGPLLINLDNGGSLRHQGKTINFAYRQVDHSSGFMRRPTHHEPSRKQPN